MHTQSSVMSEHVGMFRQKYRLKLQDRNRNRKEVYAYYFVSKKGTTQPSNTDVWFDHICDSK